MIFNSLAYAAEAYAQDGGGAGAAGFLSLGNPLFLMVAMLAIFYFLLIRPQQKKQKEHRQMLSSIQKGDTIFTAGGIHGKITGLTETTVTMEIADRVRIKVNRGSIGGLVSKGEAPPEPESSKE
ncbi:MAG: preprotein translocase subunit YajC [Desulfobacteraceae bacterium]|nr:preprotein translocase subunit YajC [Desulfobacteraceae bacterium]